MKFNGKPRICWWNCDNSGPECKLITVIAVSYDFRILCDISCKSWKAGGKKRRAGKFTISPLANFYAIIVQSSIKIILVLTLSSVKFKASTRDTEEGKKPQKVVEELHGD